MNARFKLELTVILALLVFFTGLEYALYTRHQKSTLTQKMNYTVVDTLHNVAVLFNIYLIYRFLTKVVRLERIDASSAKLLLLFNSYILATLVLFVIFKRCFLTVIANKALNVDHRSMYVTVIQRIYKLLSGTYTNRYVADNLWHNNWLKDNSFNFVLLIVFNLYAIVKLKV